MKRGRTIRYQVVAQLEASRSSTFGLGEGRIRPKLGSIYTSRSGFNPHYMGDLGEARGYITPSGAFLLASASRPEV